MKCRELISRQVDLNGIRGESLLRVCKRMV